MLDCIISIIGYWDLHPRQAPKVYTMSDGSTHTARVRSSYRPDRTKTGPVREFLGLRDSYYKAIRDHLKGCEHCRKDVGVVASVLTSRILYKSKNNVRKDGTVNVVYPGKTTYAMMRWLWQQYPANPQVAISWSVVEGLLVNNASDAIIETYKKTTL